MPQQSEVRENVIRILSKVKHPVRLTEIMEEAKKSKVKESIESHPLHCDSNNLMRICF